MTAPTSTELIRTLTDKSDIAALLFTVACAMDTRDWKLLATCFTPNPDGDFANGDATGLDAVLTEYKTFLTPLDVTQHMVSNIVCTIEDDTATAHATFQAQHLRAKAEGNGQYILGGNYDDDLVRTSTGWKIQKRRVRGLWSNGDVTVLAQPLARP